MKPLNMLSRGDTFYLSSIIHGRVHLVRQGSSASIWNRTLTISNYMYQRECPSSHNITRQYHSTRRHKISKSTVLKVLSHKNGYSVFFTMTISPSYKLRETTRLFTPKRHTTQDPWVWATWTCLPAIPLLITFFFLLEITCRKMSSE